MKFSYLKKGFLVTLVAFLALSSTACYQKQNSKPQYLVVMSAASGVISGAKNGYTLTLHNVNPHVLQFADRPARKAGFVETQKFIANWQQYFKTSNPNGAFVHANASADVNGQVRPVAFELSQPLMHANSITFKLSSLAGDQIIPGQFKHVTIFFDDVGTCIHNPKGCGGNYL